MFLNPESNEASESELAYIAIHPDFQGKGIGSLLVVEALKVAKSHGLKKCSVKTLSSTPHNVKFYEKLGYSKIKQRMGRVYLYRLLED